MDSSARVSPALASREAFPTQGSQRFSEAGSARPMVVEGSSKAGLREIKCLFTKQSFSQSFRV
jgi:hypothetical protein